MSFPKVGFVKLKSKTKSIGDVVITLSHGGINTRAYTEFNKRNVSFPMKSLIVIQPNCFGLVIEEFHTRDSIICKVLFSDEAGTIAWTRAENLRSV